MRFREISTVLKLISRSKLREQDGRGEPDEDGLLFGSLWMTRV